MGPKGSVVAFPQAKVAGGLYRCVVPFKPAAFPKRVPAEPVGGVVLPPKVPPPSEPVPPKALFARLLVVAPAVGSGAVGLTLLNGFDFRITGGCSAPLPLVADAPDGLLNRLPVD